MNDSILIVDDEIDLLDILAFNLQKNGYTVKTAASGIEALDILEESGNRFSLILLDVMMNGINGFETAQKIREKGYSTPIIFLTALDTESDILKGFSVGADDYISKPFSIKEVQARIKAVLSRATTQSSIIKFKNIILDIDTKNVSVDGENIKLTKTEFSILSLFLQKIGHIFSREELLMKVWPDDSCVVERTVDVHIARLRKKINSAGDLIVNRSGYGYCIEN
jgi:two-component system, OmpR family, alkaline phosphatase synthesis response regulator PhoP